MKWLLKRHETSVHVLYTSAKVPAGGDGNRLGGGQRVQELKRNASERCGDEDESSSTKEVVSSCYSTSTFACGGDEFCG